MLEVFILTTFLFIVWIIISFNLLARDKTHVKTNWFNIEILLKRRHELIPKLLEIITQHIDIEEAIISTISELRIRCVNSKKVAEIAALETELCQKIQQLRLLVDSSAELKANQAYLELIYRLSNIDEQIEQNCRDYNHAVKILNFRITTFPALLFARLFHFLAEDAFHTDFDSM